MFPMTLTINTAEELNAVQSIFNSAPSSAITAVVLPTPEKVSNNITVADFMKKYSLVDTNDHWRRSVKLGVKTAKFCRDNNIKYTKVYTSGVSNNGVPYGRNVNVYQEEALHSTALSLNFIEN